MLSRRFSGSHKHRTIPRPESSPPRDSQTTGDFRENSDVRQAVLQELARGWKEHADTLVILESTRTP